MEVWIIPIAVALLFTSSRCVEFHNYTKTSLAEAPQRKPIVLVPGVLGSRIQAKLNMSHSPGWFCKRTSHWFDIWLNFKELTPCHINCWVHDMSLNFNTSTKIIRNQDGVQTRIEDFGGTSSFEYLNKYHFVQYFHRLVEFLTGLGYRRRYDLKGAPFDWRLAPSILDAFFDDLTKLIEDNYYQHSNRKVVLIGHSMGNMNIYYFLKRKPQKWKDQFIDSFISISSPYIGSVKALKAIISGETEGHDFALPKLKLREASRTFASSYLLLPNPAFWPKKKSEVVVTFEKNYTVHDYEALFKRIGCKFCRELYQVFRSELGALSAPNVPVHCVYSTGLPTPEALMYKSDLFPDGDPDYETGDGDGTVNKFSSSYCLNWRKEQHQAVYDAPMPGNGHVEILSDTRLHDYIEKIVASPPSLIRRLRKNSIL